MLIIFGCAAYSVAVSKGKNRYLWFAIGLVTGPVAVLILALLPAKVTAGEKKAEAMSEAE